MIARANTGKELSRDRIEWAWLTLALIGAIDWIWAVRAGFTFEGLPQAIVLVGVLVAIGLFYGYSGRNSRFRDLGHYLALWLAFPVALNIYSYLAATMRFPLCDTQLQALDVSLGFHWLQWVTLIQAHPTAKTFLFLGYNSIFLQGFGSVAFFALTGKTQRNRELLWITMLAGMMTVAISGFAPAIGPMSGGHWPEWTAVLISIRDGSLTSTKLWSMKGIVAFPSFHTVLGIVFIYVHRPPSKIFSFVVGLNALMLLATPFVGHHYVTDMIAALAITAMSIVAYRLATAPVHQRFALNVMTQSAMTINRDPL
jgi:hypothetical protein